MVHATMAATPSSVYRCCVFKNGRPYNPIIKTYLDISMMGDDFCFGFDAANDLRGHLGLALAYMMLAEEELTVEVAGLDGIQIHLHNPDVGDGGYMCKNSS